MLERLAIAKVHPPDGPANFNRHTIEHPRRLLVPDRSMSYLRQAVADEVRIVALCQLAECLHHLAIDGGALALHAVDQASVAERHRLDRGGACVRHANACWESGAVAYHHVGVPPAAVDLEKGALDDRPAVQRVDGRLFAHARNNE